MKKFIKILSLITILVCAFLMAVGCNNPTNDTTDTETNYTISATNCTINRFDTYKLRVIPTPDANVTVEWMSRNSKVATVDNGVITAVSVGETVVEAKVGEEVFTCNVRIINNGSAPSIFVDSEDISLSKGGKFKVSPKIMYNSSIYDDGKFSYEILDENVCKIENGELIGLEYGETKLYVYGEWKSATDLELVKVIDVLVIKDSNLVIEQSDVSVYTKEIAHNGVYYNNGAQLSATLFADGKELTGKKIEWKVSDENMITVSSNGKVTANTEGNVGKAYVWAEYSDEEISVSSDKLEVNVLFPIVDKASEIEILFDNSIGTGEIDIEKVFGENTSVTEVYDAKYSYKNLYKDDKVVLDNLIEGKREWIVKGSNFGVKVTAICATKILRTQQDLHVFDEQGKNIIRGYYILDGDIDATDYVPTSHSWSSNCDFGFGGTFDGRNYAIRNIKLASGGLFGSLTASCVVKNLAFVDARVAGQVIAHTATGKLENVFVHISEKYTAKDAELHGLFSQPKGGVFENVYLLVERDSLVRKNYLCGGSNLGAWKNCYGINVEAPTIAVEQPVGIETYAEHDSANNYGTVTPDGWIRVSGIPCPLSAKTTVENFIN